MENAQKLKDSLKNSTKLRLIIPAVFLAILFIVCAGVFIAQKTDINKLETQYESYQQQLELQQKENKELEAMIQSDNLDSYMEQKARERGYVKSGEIVFYDISGSN